MAIYTSDVNRFTGLSGLDTDSMIDKMMKAESAKYDRMEKDKTLLQWKQEAYRTLMDSMKSFQDKWFGIDKTNNISYDAFWNNYTTSVTDNTTGAVSNAIKINSTTNSGSYDIEVTQKAQTETITGGKLDNAILADSAKLEKIIQDNGEISFKFNLDGISKDISITSEDLKKAGNNLEQAFNEKFDAAFGSGSIVASKDNSGKIVFKPKGDGHNLSVSESKEPAGATTNITGVLKNDNKKFSIEINGYKADVDLSGASTEDDKIKKIEEALKSAKEVNGNGGTTDLTKYISISKGKDGSLDIKNKSKDTPVKIKTTVGDTQTVEKTLTASSSLGSAGFDKTSNSITLNSKLTDIFGSDFTSKDSDTKSDEVTLNFGGKDVVLNKDDTIQSFINKVNSSGGNVKLEFNEVTTRFDIKSTQSGENGAINITDENTKKFLKDFTKIDVDNKDGSGSINSSFVKGQDAKFKVNGIETTRPSNEISMNGINFTINGTGNVKIEAKTDVDTTVKKVKEFVDDYNKLIDDIQKQVSKSREKSGKYGYYEPLTEEQKKAMSEDEVKKWEEKAKTGLLYNDDYLTRFLGDLRENIYKSVDIGGKSISLFEIGITTTSNYKDGGKLQIDEKKLKEALETRGDEVRQLFTKSKEGIGELVKKNFNDAIGSKGYLRDKAGMKGTASDMTNQLSKEMKDMTEKLAKERERLYNKEMQYFKLFSQMEAAMNKQNSQMAALLNFSG